MEHIGYVMVSSHSFPFIMALHQVTVPRFVTLKLRLQEVCEALSPNLGATQVSAPPSLAQTCTWYLAGSVSRQSLCGNSIDRSASRLPSCRPAATSSRHALCNPACLCPSYNRPIDPMGLRCHKFWTPFVGAFRHPTWATKKNNALLSIESWLFHRDSVYSLLESPFNCVVPHPL